MPWDLMPRLLIISLFIFSFAASALELPGFVDGPVIKNFGQHIPIEGLSANPNTRFKIAFDVAKGAEAGKLNRQFDSLARFINMNVAAGIPKENIDLALVVHGRAAIDLLNNTTYQKVHSQDNPNIELLQVLMQNRVQVILCGQSAGAYQISLNQLTEGVKLELSAMTAHASLQQLGYTLNPF